VVLAPHRDRPDRPLDRVGVELDATVVEEPAEGGPTDQGISDRLGQSAARRHAMQFGLEPGLEGTDQGGRLRPAGMSAFVGRAATDGRFDGIKLTDASQGLGGDR
jgi:hypothetical protein